MRSLKRAPISLLLLAGLSLAQTAPMGTPRNPSPQTNPTPRVSPVPPSTSVPQPGGQQGTPPAMAPASRIEPPGPNHKFPVGMSFTYDAEWRLWNAGTATITVTNDGASHKVNGVASST